MKKIQGDHRVAKATAWYLVCDFILKGISFITMPIFTRLLTVAEIGKFNSITSWLSILSIVVTLNLIQSIYLGRFDFKEEYDGFVSTVALLGMFSAAAFYLICFPFRSTLANWLGLEEYAFDIMCINLIFCQIPNVLVAKYRAELEYKKSVFISLGSSILVVAASLCCTILFEDKLKGRVLGLYVSQSVIYAAIFIFLVYKRNSFKWEYCRYALTICLPLIIHNLAGNLMHSSDRIMIERMDSAESAGLYGVAYSCAMVTNLLRNSMNSAWDPWVYEKINQGKTETIKKTSYPYLISFAVICIGLIALAPEALLIMGGPSYLAAKYVVPPVVMAYMFTMVYSLYAGIEQYYRKQKYFAIVTTVCAALNILLNFFFLPIYGFIAAAYTTLICMAFECALHYFHVRRMGYSNLYNTRFNLLLLLIVMGLSAILMMLYNHNVLRYIVIGIGMILIGTLIFWRRDKLREYIQIFSRKE